MSKLAILSMSVALAGCSVAFQPGAKHGAGPIVADTLLATGALVAGAVELGASCPDSQNLCLSGIDHAVGGVAIAAAAVFAVSALYGYSSYQAHQAAPPDTRARDLAAHATIAAHAGDCPSAATSAGQLKMLDRDAYVQILGDEAVNHCVFATR